MTTENPDIQEEAMITVYGQPACGPCRGVTRKLDNEHVPFDYIDLSKDENKHHLARLKATGVKMQTPIIETPTERFSGFNPAKLDAAITESRALAAQQPTVGMASPARSLG